MIIKDNYNIANEAVIHNIHRLINQIYKLLPNREEGIEWEKPLETIVEELSGMDRVLIGRHDILFQILCKLEGLLDLTKEDDFPLYRRVIFDCLGLMHNLEVSCQDSII